MESNIPWITSFSNKNLKLILFVTEQCNFRCVYCYEDFKIGKMHEEVLEGVRNLITKRIDEINVLELGFFGGEPLLNKNTVLEISNWAKQLCEGKSISYISSMTTNGYGLDKETFKNLLFSGVTNYQITLDGEKEHHDKMRPAVNGKSTFDKIIGNLKMMVHNDKNFHCTLRFNIADNNYESVKAFIVLHGKLFENDNRFSLHFHPIFGIPSLTLIKSFEKLKELKSLAQSHGLLFDNDYEEGVCYAAKANNYVIRANGKIQKCTVALNADINSVGKIFRDGTMQLDESKLKKWMFAKDKGCPLSSLSLEKLVIPYEDAGKFVNNIAVNV